MSSGSWLALPSELPESPVRVTRPMQRLCGSAGALSPLPVPSLSPLPLPSLSPLPVPSPLPGGVTAVPAACVVPAAGAILTPGVPLPSLLLSLSPQPESVSAVPAAGCHPCFQCHRCPPWGSCVPTIPVFLPATLLGSAFGIPRGWQYPSPCQAAIPAGDSTGTGLYVYF